MSTCTTLLAHKPLFFPFSSPQTPTNPSTKAYLHFHPLHSPRSSPLQASHSSSSSSSSSSSAVAAATDPPPDEDTVEELFLHAEPARVQKLMKMERKDDDSIEDQHHWFPYLDCFRTAASSLTSDEVIAATEGSILDVRKEKMRRVVASRSYAISLVVEGLTDFGNVSAVLRSADALGVQSVHVIAKDNRKRYRDNRHVSRGAEKWLDIELWTSPAECFGALRRRGYRIATTHVGGDDTVSVYDMDWSVPTAVVVGNEHKGISEEALRLSDLHCCVPMNGMVDSFNVSVAAGVLMHHAVCDRISRLGAHGDLSSEERRILLAEFFLRHRESTIGFVKEFGKRKMSEEVMCKL